MVDRTLEDRVETEGQYADIDVRTRPWFCGAATARGRRFCGAATARGLTVTGTGNRG